MSTKAHTKGMFVLVYVCMYVCMLLCVYWTAV